MPNRINTKRTVTLHTGSRVYVLKSETGVTVHATRAGARQAKRNLWDNYRIETEIRPTVLVL